MVLKLKTENAVVNNTYDAWCFCPCIATTFANTSPMAHELPTNPTAAIVAVKGIKKQHLVEIRSLGSPPPAVKMALESICTLLGEPNTEWKNLRSIIMKDNFIPSIVNFDTEAIP